MFTVKELLMCFVNPYGQLFRIWDGQKEDIVYDGYLDDLPDRYADAYVTSIDNIEEERILTINVDERD